MRDYLDPMFFKRSGNSTPNGLNGSPKTSNNGNSKGEAVDPHPSYRQKSKASYTYYHKCTDPATSQKQESSSPVAASQTKKTQQ